LWPIAIALATLLACGWQSVCTIPTLAGVTTDIASPRQNLLIVQTQASPSLPAAKQTTLPPPPAKAQTSPSRTVATPTALLPKPPEKVPLKRLRQLGYLSVLLGGAFGGLIYSISRNSGAIMPYRISLREEESQQTYAKWNLGIWADMMVGIGGGILIFNLIPQAGPEGLFETLWKDEGGTEGRVVTLLMKILALSLIGGFAGISLFDEAAKRINSEVKSISAQAKNNRNAIDTLNRSAMLESDIQFFLSRIVDRSISNLTTSEAEKFRAAVLQTPLHLRNKVFEGCKESLDANRILGWRTVLSKPEIESRLTQLEGLIIGFESLIAAADEQVRSDKGPDMYKHRYIAHKGFIHQQLAAGNELLDRPGNSIRHWNMAESLLDQAIELRDKTPEQQVEFWHYDLAHIFCLFKLNRKDKASEQLNGSDARSWASKDRGVLFANLRGFRTPPLGTDVTPPEQPPEEFLDWVESKMPGVVPEELQSPPSSGSDTGSE
jgi:hypothetical protein